MDTVVLDVERLGVSQAPGSQRTLLSDNNQPSVTLEPLSPPNPEATPRTPADITIAVTSKDRRLSKTKVNSFLSLTVCFLFLILSHQAAAISLTETQCLLEASSVRWSCRTSRPHSTSMMTINPEAHHYCYSPLAPKNLPIYRLHFLDSVSCWGLIPIMWMNM